MKPWARYWIWAAPLLNFNEVIKIDNRAGALQSITHGPALFDMFLHQKAISLKRFVNIPASSLPLKSDLHQSLLVF